YTPFGELFAGLLMGTVMIAISYYIQTMMVTIGVILISLPIAIFIGAILLSNNIRDLDNDKESGRKTIAILFGRKKAIQFLVLLFAIAYGLTCALIINDIFLLCSIITLFSIKVSVDFIKGFIVIKIHIKFIILKTTIEKILVMTVTVKTNSVYGFLL